MKSKHPLNRNTRKGCTDSSKSLSSTCNSTSTDSLISNDPDFNNANSNSHFVTQTNLGNSPQDAKNKLNPKKAYTCTYCQKIFTRPSALQTHTYTHTAEKPFQCSSPNCGRYFSVVSNLRRHFKIHQKTQQANKLSSEDRIRCVKQLMLRSNDLTPDMSQTLTEKELKQYDMTCKNNSPKSVVPILPALTSDVFQNKHNKPFPYSYLPTPPLTISPTFENQLLPGEADSHFLSNTALFSIPRAWPTQLDQNFCIKNSPLDGNAVLKSGSQANNIRSIVSYHIPEQLQQGEVPVSNDKNGNYLFFL